jgi:hypothetical protein
MPWKTFAHFGYSAPRDSKLKTIIIFSLGGMVCLRLASVRNVVT